MLGSSADRDASLLQPLCFTAVARLLSVIPKNKLQDLFLLPLFMHNSRHASFLAAFLSDSHRNLETLFSTSVERDMKIVDLPTGDTGLLCSTFKLLCFTINLPSAKDALSGRMVSKLSLIGSKRMQALCIFRLVVPELGSPLGQMHITITLLDGETVNQHASGNRILRAALCWQLHSQSSWVTALSSLSPAHDSW